MDRDPVVAGRFYPDDENALTEDVAGYIGPEPSEENAIGLVVPHASLAYSGRIAGPVYARARVPPVVVVLSPNHTGHGARAAILTHGTWRIPGARVPVDRNAAEELRRLALLTEDGEAHRHEHSLELQLPFLVGRNRRVRIVPVCLSYMPYAACVRIGTALADVVQMHGRDLLLVASTDMSHYVAADEAREKDRKALDRIEALDPEGLYRTVMDEDISMCGFIPTTVMLIAAKSLGATSAELVGYGHSGETSGDHRRVVGYSGWVIR